LTHISSYNGTIMASLISEPHQLTSPALGVSHVKHEQLTEIS
jgi:hypothetical protein